MKKIQGIFKPEKLKIKPSVIKLPKQLNLKWETVGGPDPKRALLYKPSDIFLDNIDSYRYNRFLNIGKRDRSITHTLRQQIIFVQVSIQFTSGSSRTS